MFDLENEALREECEMLRKKVSSYERVMLHTADQQRMLRDLAIERMDERYDARFHAACAAMTGLLSRGGEYDVEEAVEYADGLLSRLKR